MDTNLLQIKLMTCSKILVEAIEACEPGTAVAMMVGFLSATTNELSDETWKEMLVAAPKPCGHPGCDCEHSKKQAMEVMDALRTRFKQKFES